MKSHLDTSLELLHEKVYTGTAKYHFPIGKEREQLKLIEEAYGIVFPESYFQFLEFFDGGMICEYEDHYYTDMTDWEPDGPKESSIYLYGLDEVIDSFTDFRLDNTFLEKGINGLYPFIPIGKTPNHGIIFLLSQRALKEESPIFIIYDKKELSQAQQIASCFDDFLSDYLKHDGFPSLKLYKDLGLCSDYVKSKGVLKIAHQKESPQESITRNTALMELFPKDGMNYLERANAYLENGRRELALLDYNKAIELEPKDALFHYFRGEFIAKYGSLRKALIDMDIAVKLEPDSHLYLSGRADALYQLGKLNLALEDCNKILEKDGVDILALSTRVRIYRDLGEHKKADADSALLDELYR